MAWDVLISTGIVYHIGDPPVIRQASSIPVRSRQSLLPLLTLGSLTLVGCGAFQLGGVKRSPNFATGNAPEPAVITAVVPCVHSSLPAGSGETSIARFSAIERSQVKAEPVAVPRATADILCTTAAASDNFHFKEWNAAPSLAGVMHELALAHGAKSIAVPIIRLFARCEQDTQTVKNANGATVGTVELASKTCREDPTKYVGLFIFREDGTLIYKSTQAPGNPMGGGGDLEQSMVAVFQAIPASFSTAASAEPQPAPDPAEPTNSVTAAEQPGPNAIAADDGKIEAALGVLDPKTPAECKTFVQTVCHDSRVPAASRVATCSGYVATIKQLLKSKRTQAVQACVAMSKSLSASK